MSYHDMEVEWLVQPRERPERYSIWYNRAFWPTVVKVASQTGATRTLTTIQPIWLRDRNAPWQPGGVWVDKELWTTRVDLPEELWEPLPDSVAVWLEDEITTRPAGIFDFGKLKEATDGRV